MTLTLKTTVLSTLFLLSAALENGHDLSPFANAPEPSPITLAALDGHSSKGNNLQSSGSQSYNPPPRSPFSTPAFSHYHAFDASATNLESDGFSGDFSPNMGPFQKYFSGDTGNPISQTGAAGPFGGPGGFPGRPGGRGAPPSGARGAFPSQQQQQQYRGGFGGGLPPQQQYGGGFKGGVPPQQQQFGSGLSEWAGFGGRQAGAPFGGQRSLGGFGGPGSSYQGFGGPPSGYSGYSGQQQQQRGGAGFGFF